MALVATGDDCMLPDPLSPGCRRLRELLELEVEAIAGGNLGGWVGVNAVCACVLKDEGRRVRCVAFASGRKGSLHSQSNSMQRVHHGRAHAHLPNSLFASVARWRRRPAPAAAARAAGAAQEAPGRAALRRGRQPQHPPPQRGLRPAGRCGGFRGSQHGSQQGVRCCPRAPRAHGLARPAAARRVDGVWGEGAIAARVSAALRCAVLHCVSPKPIITRVPKLPLANDEHCAKQPASILVLFEAHGASMLPLCVPAGLSGG
jgi:hypothetical protein